ncbi:MAG: 1-acyl-sn-glycerol-3-phosphate acyltransferase [Ruminococcaceae bacterium]|jgi:1-acyl-sn-glycerol-3-phosphate acyltransferase|nr:1-acyl-sn-glycerol-3-phosphate acyltransferase [Oscillospiraceae bacterium]
MSFYETIYRIFSPLVKRLWRIEAVGTEHIPAEGAILASNHTAFSDVLVISAAAGRQVRYMAKKELFKTPLAPLIKALGAYPVDRGGSDVGSIRNTIRLVESGELVGIFPQGHRYGGRDPRGTEIRSGVGMIAYHTKAPVVPVFLYNKRRKTGIFRKNTVTFGVPVAFDEMGFERGGRSEYMNAARIVFDRICRLNEEDSRKGD